MAPASKPSFFKPSVGTPSFSSPSRPSPIGKPSFFKPSFGPPSFGPPSFGPPSRPSPIIGFPFNRPRTPSPTRNPTRNPTRIPSRNPTRSPTPTSSPLPSLTPSNSPIPTMSPYPSESPSEASPSPSTEFENFFPPSNPFFPPPSFGNPIYPYYPSPPFGNPIYPSPYYPYPVFEPSPPFSNGYDNVSNGAVGGLVAMGVILAVALAAFLLCKVKKSRDEVPAYSAPPNSDTGTNVSFPVTAIPTSTQANSAYPVFSSAPTVPVVPLVPTAPSEGNNEDDVVVEATPSSNIVVPNPSAGNASLFDQLQTHINKTS